MQTRPRHVQRWIRSEQTTAAEVSASAPEAADSPELTDTNAAISDSDRCLLEAPVSKDRQHPYAAAPEVFTLWAQRVQLYAHRGITTRGRGWNRTDQCTVAGVEPAVGRRVIC